MKNMIRKLMTVLALGFAGTALATSVDVSTFAQLKEAIKNTSVDVINVTDDIDVPCASGDAYMTKTAALQVSRNLTIQGKNAVQKTIKRTGSTGATGDGSYLNRSILEIYGNGTYDGITVTLRNIIFDGGAVWASGSTPKTRHENRGAHAGYGKNADAKYGKSSLNNGVAGRSIIDVANKATLNLEGGAVVQNGECTNNSRTGSDLDEDNLTNTYGGCIRVECYKDTGGGTVNVKSGAVVQDGVASSYGGGIGAYNLARINIYGGTIRRCSAKLGGGIGVTWADDAYDPSTAGKAASKTHAGVISTSGGLIEDCWCSVYGAALVVEGTAVDCEGDSYYQYSRILGLNAKNCVAEQKGAAIAVNEGSSTTIYLANSPAVTATDCTGDGNYTGQEYGTSSCIYRSSGSIINAITSIHKVTFFDGADLYGKIQVEHGRTAGAMFPADPARTGMVFTEWRTNLLDSASKITKDTVINSDVTAYAYWVSVKVSLDDATVPNTTYQVFLKDSPITPDAMGKYYVPSNEQNIVVVFTANPNSYFADGTTAKTNSIITSTNPATVQTPLPSAPAQHQHCICGTGTCKVGGHTHDDPARIWTAWTKTDSLPTTADNWYLVNDVTLTAEYKPGNGVNLCLNGHTVTQTTDGARVISVVSTSSMADHTFALTDCVQTGKITGGTITGSNNYGGGVNVATNSSVASGKSVFKYYGGIICDNTATSVSKVGSGCGGGACVNSGCEFYMYGGVISNNTATSIDNYTGTGRGAGLFVSGTGKAFVYGGDICYNTANRYGGGVEIGSGGSSVVPTMTFGGTARIFGNKGGCGGGICCDTGSQLTVTGGEIFGNEAKDDYLSGGDKGKGGGLYLYEGPHTISNCDIRNNRASVHGGGICHEATAAVTIGGTLVVTNNTVGGVLENAWLATGETFVLSSLASDSKIGVTLASAPAKGAKTAFTTNGSTSDLAKFTSDNSSYLVVYDTDHLALEYPDIVYVEVKAPSPAMEHATFKVLTNGVEITKTGDKWLVPTNTAPVQVVYLADPDWYFSNRVAAVTNTVDATKNPVIDANQPAAPLQYVQIIPETVPNTTYKVYLDDEEITPPPYYVPSNAAPVKIVYEADPGYNFPDGSTVKTNTLETTATGNDPASPLPAKPASPVVFVEVKEPTPPMEHTTFKVLTNGVEIAKTGDKWLVPTNTTPVEVVYVATEPYYFSNRVAAVTNTVDASKNPVIDANRPDAPGLYVQIIPEELTNTTVKVFWGDKEIAPPPYYVPSNASPVKIVYETKPGHYFPDGTTVKTNELEEAATHNDPASPLPTKPAAPVFGVVKVTTASSTTYYETLAPAFASIGAGGTGTVTMLQDLTLAETGAAWVPDDADITFDLNGRKIDWTTSKGDALLYFDQGTDGKLKIRDSASGGTIVSTCTSTEVTNSAIVVYCKGDGDLTVEGGTFVCSNKIGAASLFFKDGNGDWTFTNGTYRAVSEGAGNADFLYLCAATGTTVVTGGDFDITAKGAAASGVGASAASKEKVTLTGGDFDIVSAGAWYGAFTAGNGTLIAKGGDFNVVSTGAGVSCFTAERNGTTIISNGTFYAESKGAYAYAASACATGNLVVAGGTLSAKAASETCATVIAKENSAVTITQNPTIVLPTGTAWNLAVQTVGAHLDFTGYTGADFEQFAVFKDGTYGESYVKGDFAKVTNGVIFDGYFSTRPTNSWVQNGKYPLHNTNAATRVAYPWTVGLVVTYTPPVVSNATATVCTNGVPMEVADPYILPTNVTDVTVIYTAKPGYTFPDGTTVKTNDVNTSTQPATTKGTIPSEPLVFVEVKEPDPAMKHTTFKVLTNGVEIAKIGGKWLVPTNTAPVEVVYEADPDWYFTNRVAAITNTVDATLNPVVDANRPEDPLQYVQIIPEEVTNATYKVYWGDKEITPPPYYVPSNASPVKIVYEADPGFYFPGGNTAKTNELEATATKNDPASPLPAAPAAPMPPVKYVAPVYKGTDNNPTNGIARWETNTVYGSIAVMPSTGAVVWDGESAPIWYVVTNDVTISGGVACLGDVNLILCDGAKLTVTTGDEVAGIATDRDGSFTVYAQESGTGALEVTGGERSAAIGGSKEDVGYSSKSGDNITLNGGVVTAVGGRWAAGIGGSYGGNGVNIVINGGTVKAVAGELAAAIGGGQGHETEGLVINGGSIAVVGNADSDLIGCGKGGHDSCDVLIAPTANILFSVCAVTDPLPTDVMGFAVLTPMTQSVERVLVTGFGDSTTWNTFSLTNAATAATATISVNGHDRYFAARFLSLTNDASALVLKSVEAVEIVPEDVPNTSYKVYRGDEELTPPPYYVPTNASPVYVVYTADDERYFDDGSTVKTNNVDASKDPAKIEGPLPEPPHAVQVITYDAMDGMWADGATVTDVKATVDQRYVLPATEPTRANYTFKGWYVSWTNGAAKVANGDPLDVYVDHRIYAKWDSESIGPSVVGDVLAGKDADGGAATIVMGAVTNGDGNVVSPLADGLLALPERIGTVDAGKFVKAIARKAYQRDRYDDKVPEDRKLRRVLLPTYLTTIGDNAFYLCDRLTNVTFAVTKDYRTNAKTAVSVGSYAFAGTAIEKLVIPAGAAVKLSANAFAQCPNLREIKIYGTILGVEKGVFAQSGNGGEVTVHLSPDYAADANFVAMLTADMNTTHVKISTEPLGQVAIEGVPAVSGTDVTVRFRASIESPWMRVNENTVALFYTDDLAKGFTGTGKVAYPDGPVTQDAAGVYTATFTVPDAVGDKRFYRLTIGAERTPSAP